MLQARRKWTNDQPNICVGDIVLLKDKEVARIYWPIGRITEIFSSDDDKIRKVKVTIVKNGETCHYTRPIVDIILLISV